MLLYNNIITFYKITNSILPVDGAVGVVKLAHLSQHLSLASALAQSVSLREKHSASLSNNKPKINL